MIPTLKIFNQNMALIGETDLAESVRFSRSWQYFGDLEAIFPFNAAMLEIIRKDRIITIGKDERKAYIITGIIPKEDADGARITVRGHHLDALTDRRITLAHGGEANLGYCNVPELAYDGEIVSPISTETIYKEYVRRCMTEPDDIYRTIQRLTISADQQRGMQTKWMSLGEKLSDVFQSIGEYTDTGYVISVDFVNRLFRFDISLGNDLTTDQMQKRPVIFGLEFASIKSLERNTDTSNYRNVAYAAGAGEGFDRSVFKCCGDDAEPTGISRREVWMDCGNLPILESNEEISLETEALHRLKDFVETDEITFEASNLGTFRYGIDYDLGDLVTIRSRKMNLTVNRRITKIEEFYSHSEISLLITVGKSSDRIDRKIKKYIRNI